LSILRLRKFPRIFDKIVRIGIRNRIKNTDKRGACKVNVIPVPVPAYIPPCEVFVCIVRYKTGIYKYLIDGMGKAGKEALCFHPLPLPFLQIIIF
jgi:hypothetical protein